VSKLFKRHVPKPAGPAAAPAGPPRAKTVARGKPDEALAAKAGPKTPRGAGKTEEIGGPEGPEPTRYGDWEIKGRCIDF